MTNRLIAASAVLSLGLTALHVIGGGESVHGPLLASDATPVLKGFISVVWHGVTAALIMCTGMLSVASVQGDLRKPLTGLVIVYYVAFAGLFLFYGITRLGSVLLMPPWIVFLGVVALATAGLVVEAREPKS